MIDQNPIVELLFINRYADMSAYHDTKEQCVMDAALSGTSGDLICSCHCESNTFPE